MGLDRLLEVVRTCRMETAVGSEQKAEKFLVKIDYADHELGHHICGYVLF